MLKTYTYPKFEYRRPPELDGDEAPWQRPVVVVGAGPVGLTAAIDLQLQGVPVVLVDDDETVSIGSRGLCYAKRTLEILDRCGVGEAVVQRGVNWQVGRTFFGEEEVFHFDLLPEPGHQRPGMVNLQQYHLEDALVKRAEAVGVQLRWKQTVVGVQPREDGVQLQVQSPDGIYTLDAAWLVVCDGARSPIRRMLGLDIEGRIFMDRFLIADVVMKAPFPAERWFWFDPPFHRNQSVLLHREADDVWRIDFQLGWDADPVEERKPENVIPRIRAMLGEGVEFDLEWVSVYTFQCRRMASFDYGRVLFAGDAAHQVSPFGARGANSGIQDADNLAWKLRLVLQGLAPASLLASYTWERAFAADENLQNSTRSTDFITPKSETSKRFRNAVLQLARTAPFARKLVNSGRLSVPSFYTQSPLNTPDEDVFAGVLCPGAPMPDAPVSREGQPVWLLDQLGGSFQLLLFADGGSAATGQEGAAQAGAGQGDAGLGGALVGALADAAIPVQVVWVLPRQAVVSGVAGVADGTPPAGMGGSAQPVASGAAAALVLVDTGGLVAQRLDARPGTAILLRPDQHIAARWRRLEVARVRAAVARATGQPESVAVTAAVRGVAESSTNKN